MLLIGTTCALASSFVTSRTTIYLSTLKLHSCWKRLLSGEFIRFIYMCVWSACLQFAFIPGMRAHPIYKSAQNRAENGDPMNLAIRFPWYSISCRQRFVLNYAISIYNYVFFSNKVWFDGNRACREDRASYRAYNRVWSREMSHSLKR